MNDCEDMEGPVECPMCGTRQTDPDVHRGDEGYFFCYLCGIVWNPDKEDWDPELKEWTQLDELE